METEHWQRIEAIFNEALDQEPGRRSEFVLQACGGDELLRRDVESLLAEADEEESFLEEPALHVAAKAIASSAAAAGETSVAGQHPASIGRYRIIRLLGEGGMGAVYEAEQEDPRRVVALKVIRPGLATPERLRRFRRESQALGRLQHSGIVQIYDAGTANAGFGLQPYFAMELVRGEPLDRFVTTHPMNTQQKLALMARICEAVHHAHQRGLIHRDLKPGNILIDETGQPKILDFGVARLTEAEAQLTVQTEVGQIVGTLAYMSPEQVTGDPFEVDTRSDVYSLGVILYQVLTGELPYSLSGRQIPEAVRTIRESDPTPLSSISRNYRGDIETIVGKALEKDKAQRYESAAALTEDIERHLRDEPILARAPSTSYQLSKFARRHRALAIGVAAVFLVLVAGISVSTTLAIRARRAEQAAIAERDRATRITDFMTGIFKVSDPNQARGNSVTAREILDEASSDMGRGLAEDPEVQLQMMQVMASTYSNLGLYARAHELAKSALDDRLKLLGPNDPKTLESMSQLGSILLREGRYLEAEKLERQALVGERRTLGAEQSLTIETMDYLAYTELKQGRYDDAEKLLREAIEVGTRRLGSGDKQVLLATNLLGVAFLDQARYVEAEEDYRPLVDVDRRVFGPDDPRTLSTVSNLAIAVKHQGRSVEAEALYREVLAAQQRVYGAGNATTAYTMENLADLLTREGRPADAEKLSRDALAIRLRIHGAEHPDTLVSKMNLSDELFREGHIHEAEKLQREALATQIRVVGPEDPNSLICRTYLARTLTREGRYADAEEIARQAYDVQLRTLGPQHPDTLDALRQLGRALAYSDRYAEASALFHDAIDKQDTSKGQGNPFSVWYSFACVAVAAKRPDDALEYLREAINRGYKDGDGLMTEEDLKNLRPNPKFQQLVAALKHPPTRARTQ